MLLIKSSEAKSRFFVKRFPAHLGAEIIGLSFVRRSRRGRGRLDFLAAYRINHVFSPDGILSEISFQNVLLNHPMGIEERAVESHGVQHDIDETVALVVKHGNDHVLQFVVER